MSLDQAIARIKELERELADERRLSASMEIKLKDKDLSFVVPMEIAVTAMKALEEVGMGQEGKPNTLTAMVLEACKTIKDRGHTCVGVGAKQQAD